MREVATVRTADVALTVHSNAPGLQVYTGNFLDGSVTGTGGRVYRQGDGFALEPQLFPDTPNQPAFGDATLRPGETFRRSIRWDAEVLETSVVAAGGCAAVMYTAAEWTASAPGRAVRGEPLIQWDMFAEAPALTTPVDPTRPLATIRVLDLTRVLAGPVATRFLALLGADVLRVDPPTWDEPGVLPEVMLGKRSARLDLRSDEGRDAFLALASRADLVVESF